MPLLTIQSLTKRFGGLTALNRFDLQVNTGEIIGIIGPNGSGKTTLFNTLTGLYRADGGRVHLEGHEGNLLERKTHQIIALGISRTFQNQRPFNNLSVLENLLVGGHCRYRGGITSALFNFPPAIKEREQMSAWAYDVMGIFGDRLLSMQDKPAWNLSYANRRRLEIARAMVSKPRLLLLDEPTAGMNPAESLQLLDSIRHINRTGTTILVIEHDMNFIKKLCPRIVALDYGQKIIEGAYDDVRHHPKVIEAYLGKD